MSQFDHENLPAVGAMVRFDWDEAKDMTPARVVRFEESGWITILASANGHETEMWTDMLALAD